jgi:glutathione transport system permease protein
MLLAISLFSIPVYARLARNLATALRKATYVEAAIAMGAGPARVMFIHILPNAAGPILVQCTVSAGSVILTAASLSFLGLGVEPPAPEWGAMMSDGRNYVGAYLLPSLFPGLAITLAVLGFNLLGEGLRGLSDRQ